MLSRWPWWCAPVFGIGVDRHPCRPTASARRHRAKLIAALRSMPLVDGTLGSSWLPGSRVCHRASSDPDHVNDRRGGAGDDDRRAVVVRTAHALLSFLRWSSRQQLGGCCIARKSARTAGRYVISSADEAKRRSRRARSRGRRRTSMSSTQSDRERRHRDRRWFLIGEPERAPLFERLCGGV